MKQKKKVLAKLVHLSELQLDVCVCVWACVGMCVRALQRTVCFWSSVWHKFVHVKVQMSPRPSESFSMCVCVVCPCAQMCASMTENCLHPRVKRTEQPVSDLG